VRKNDNNKGADGNRQDLLEVHVCLLTIFCED
jgi:hypothetical protein